MASEFKIKNGLIVVGDVSTSGTITINGALAATQSWVTSQAYLTSSSLTSYATQSYVTSAIASLVDSAPGALDTLRELATALGNDASFSTTVTNSIAAKQSQLNGTGLVRMSGTSVSYDNTTYLISNFGNIEGDHTYGYPSSNGWYKIAEVVFNGACQSYNLWGEYRDTGYFDNSHYRIHITARAECDFPTNNESHAINVNIYGSSTNETYFSNNVRVVLTSSSSNYRKYELQYYRETWDTGSWNLQNIGWTTYTTSQTAGTPTGTARVYYISKFVADNIYAANKISIGTSYSGFAANIAGTTYVIGASVWVNDGYGISNASSGGTGFFPYSDGTLVFNSANSEKMRISVGGLVGIGTSNPLSKFHVRTNTNQNFRISSGTNLEVASINDADSTYVPLTFRASSFDFQNGNVGIGTASPTEKLVIAGGGNVATQVEHSNVGWFRIKNTSTGNYWHMEHDYGDNDLRFGTSVSNGMLTLLSSGNIGIATTTPQKKLDVFGGAGIVASFGASISPGEFAGLHFGYSESYINNDSYKKSALVFERTDNNNQGGNASGKIHFLLNNYGSSSATSLTQSVVTIDSDANGTAGSVRMGIGTRNPSSALEVIGTIRNKNASVNSNYSQLSTTEATLTLSTYSINTGSYPANIIFSPASTEAMRINTVGKVSIGTTDTNSDKSDFTVYTGGNTSIALAGNLFRVGESDINWDIALRQNGTLQTYGQALNLNTQAGNYAVNVQPNGVTSAQFYQSETYINTYAKINYNWGGGTYGTEAFTIRGTYPSLTLRSTNADNKWLFHNDGSGDLRFYQGSGVDTNSWTNYITFNRSGQIDAIGGNSSQWNTAYGWGNHASAGYVTSSGSVSYATTAGALTSMNISQFTNNSGYVAYGNYSWTSPVFGQYGIKSNLIDNVLYSAADRFEVFKDGSPWNTNTPFNLNYDQSCDVIPTSTSRTYSIILNTKGNPSYGIVYTEGNIYLSFYYVYIPGSVSGRVRFQNGTWVAMSGWTNVSNNGSLAVWRSNVPGGNYMVEIEITINANSSNDTWFAQWEYVMGRPGQYELGIINKAQDNSLWRNMYFRDSSNNAQVSIGPGGLSTSQNLNISGTSSLNFNSYSGGFYMQDSSWIRTVNYKSIWTQTGLLGTDGGLTVGYGGTTPPSGGAIIAGNVGIGTSSPSYKLDVTGDINFTSTLKFGGTTVLSNSGADVYGNIRVLSSNSNVNDGMYLNYNSSGGTGAHLRFFANGATERMRIDASSGNVGIGTTSPSYKLDVSGNSRTTGIHYVDTYLVTPYIYGGGPITMGNDVRIAGVGTKLYFDTLSVPNSIYQYVENNYDLHFINTRGDGARFVLGNNIISFGTVSAVRFSISQVTGAATFSSSIQTTDLRYSSSGFLTYGTGTIGTETFTIRNGAASPALTILYGGNVGIGTTTPANKLVVTSDASPTNENTYAIAAASASDPAYKTIIGYDYTNDIGLIAAVRTGIGWRNLSIPQGSLGIGTYSPNVKLHVVGNAWINRPTNKVDNASCTELPSRVEFNNAFASGQSGYMIFRYPTYNNFLISGDYDGNIGGAIPNIQFGRQSTVYLHMNSSNGNIGIGTTSPSYKLHVVGDLYVNGTNGAFTTDNSQSNLYFLNLTRSTTSLVTAGNVGIKVANPTATLSLGTSSYDNNPLAGLEYSQVTGGGRLDLKVQTWGTGSNYGLTTGLSVLTPGFDTADVRVGIGTTSPATPLHVTGGATGTGGWNRTATLAATYPGLIFNSNGTKWGGMAYDYSAAMRFWVNANNDDIFAGTQAMSILNNGNVGIGTSNPIYKLQVAGSAYVNGGTLFIDSGEYLRWGNSNQGIVGVNDSHVAIVSGGATRQTIYAEGRTYFPGLDLSISNINGSHGSGTYFRGDGGHFVFGLSSGNTLYLNYGNSAGILRTFGTWYHESTQILSTSRVLTNVSGNISMFTNDAGYLTSVSDIWVNTAGDTMTGSLLFAAVANNVRLEKSGSFLNLLDPYNNIHLYNGGSGVYIDSPVYYFRSQAADYWMTLNSTGLGIGTQSPEAKLHIVSGSGQAGFLSRGTNGDTWFPYSNGQNYVRGITNFDNASVYFTGGNIGIGTNTPSKLLEVAGDIMAGTSNKIGFRYSGGDSNFYNYITANNANPLTLVGGMWTATGAIEGIRFSTYNGAALSILNNGNVGIGTVSPTSRLHVYDNSDVWHTRIGGASGELRIGGQTSSGAVIQALTPGGSLRQLYLQRDGGNVGIGNDNPTATLQINGAGGDSTPTLRLISAASDTFNWASDSRYANLTAGETSIHLIGKANSQYNQAYFGYRHVADGSASNMLTLGLYASDYLVNILGNGNVGIGTTSPSEKLHVAGRIMAAGSGYTLNPTAPIFGQYSSTRGYIQVPSNGQFEIWTGGTSEIATFYNNQNAAFFGNVGIGTTSPAEKFHVLGRGIFDGGSGDSSTDAVLYVTKSNNNDWGLYVNAVGLDYGMYSRVSPSAGYAIAVNNGTTWTTRITGDGRIYLNEKDTIASYDGWLRLNSSAHYTSGVYTPYALRNDGAFDNYGGIYGYNTIRARKLQTVNNYTTAALWTESYDLTTTGIAFHISGIAGKFLEMRTDGILYWENNKVWTAGNDGSGSGLDADLLDGQNSTEFLRLLSGGAEASLDSYTDNGFRSVSFAGHSQHLLSWNAGGSTGTVQQLFHYGVPNNGWRIRNKTDNSSWSDWGYVVMASSNQGLISGTIATQSWVGSQSYATTSYVTTQINNLIAGAPGALDTLDELAAALGDDASFATTVTNSIAGKVSKAGDTMTGNLTLKYNTSNSADYNALLFAAGSDDYIIKASTTQGVFGRQSFGWHVAAGSAFGVYSSGWVKLFGVEGGTGNTQIFGNLTVNGTITESSSLKLKENVKTSEGNLEKVVNLRPVTYNKIGSQTKELGLIAEEVATVYPEFVQYDENGEPIGVNYSRLTAALIGAVKELTQRIETLENNG